MKRQRTLRLDVDRLEAAGLELPDVGDVLLSTLRAYLVVDATRHRRYLHVLCDVYVTAPNAGVPPELEADGTVWTLG